MKKTSTRRGRKSCCRFGYTFIRPAISYRNINWLTQLSSKQNGCDLLATQCSSELSVTVTATEKRSGCETCFSARRRCRRASWMTSRASRKWTKTTTSMTIGRNVGQTAATAAAAAAGLDVGHRARTALSSTLTFTASLESLDPPQLAPRRHYAGQHHKEHIRKKRTRGRSHIGQTVCRVSEI